MSRPISRRGLLQAAGLGAVALPILGACSGKVGQAGAGDGAKTSSASELIHLAPDVTFIQQWALGYEAAAVALGLSSEVAYNKGDPGTEVSLTQTALSRGVDFLCTCAPTDDVVNQVANLVAQQRAQLATGFGTPAWKMLDSDFDASYRVALSPPLYTLAYTMGKALFEDMGGGGKVAHMMGPEGSSTTYVRAAGFRAAAKEFPGITLVERFGDWGRSTAQATFSGLLSSDPDIKGVVAHNDDMGMGCIAVLRNSKIDGVKVAGIDAVPDFVQDMAAGGHAFATASLVGPWIGAWLLVQLYDAVNGVEYDPLERMVMSSGLVVKGPEAAKGYAGLFFDDAKVKTLYDPKKMSRHLNGDNWEPQNTVAVLQPLDPKGLWVPAASAGGAPKPEGFAPSAAWSGAAANGGIEKLNASWAARAAANDPLASIRSVVGQDIV